MKSPEGVHSIESVHVDDTGVDAQLVTGKRENRREPDLITIL